MKRILFLVLVVALGGTLLASNMGFKLAYSLGKTAGMSGTNWVGLPYFWGTSATAATVCTDIGANATEVGKYNEATDTSTFWSCGGRGTPFTLTAGQGVYVKVNTAATIWTIVGSHDPSLAVTMGKTASMSGTNWISVPYHTTSTTAQTICAESYSGGAPTEVGRYNEATDTSTFWSCGGRGTPFTLTAGQAVYIKVNTAGTTWTPAHY